MSLGLGLARFVRLMWGWCEADVSYTTPRPPPSLPMAPLLARWARRRSGNTNIYLFVPTSDEILYRLLFHWRHDIDLMLFVLAPCYKLSRRRSGAEVVVVILYPTFLAAPPRAAKTVIFQSRGSSHTLHKNIIWLMENVTFLLRRADHRRNITWGTTSNKTRSRFVYFKQFQITHPSFQHESCEIDDMPAYY